MSEEQGTLSPVSPCPQRAPSSPHNSMGLVPGACWYRITGDREQSSFACMRPPMQSGCLHIRPCTSSCLRCGSDSAGTSCMLQQSCQPCPHTTHMDAQRQSAWALVEHTLLVVSTAHTCTAADNFAAPAPGHVPPPRRSRQGSQGRGAPQAQSTQYTRHTTQLLNYVMHITSYILHHTCFLPLPRASPQSPPRL